jgi:transposase-like protein
MKHVREVLQLMTVLTGDDRFARVTESEVETSKAKTIAIKMYQTGCDTEYIAKILDIDVETVLDWLSAAGEI